MSIKIFNKIIGFCTLSLSDLSEIFLGLAQLTKLSGFETDNQKADGFQIDGTHRVQYRRLRFN